MEGRCVLSCRNMEIISRVHKVPKATEIKSSGRVCYLMTISQIPDVIIHHYL